MPRRTGPILEQPTWTEASAERPCPVCGRTEGCSVLEGEEFVRCMTALSPWPVAGGGWLHRSAAGDAEGG